MFKFCVLVLAWDFFSPVINKFVFSLLFNIIYEPTPSFYHLRFPERTQIQIKRWCFTCVVQFSILILSSPKRQLYAFFKMWLSGKAMRRAQYFRVWTCCFSKRGKWPVSPYMARVGICLLTPSMFFEIGEMYFLGSHFALYHCIVFQSHTWE